MADCVNCRKLERRIARLENTLATERAKTKPRRKTNTTARSRLLENAINGLQHLNFELYKNTKEFEQAKQTGILPDRYIIRNYPHLSYCGTPGRKEAYIFDRSVEYIFEAKYQNTSGSVDEKLPSIWRNFLKSPVPNWIVWFDGNFWLNTERAQAAIADLRQIAKECPAGRRFDICATDRDWIELTKKLFVRSLAA